MSTNPILVVDDSSTVRAYHHMILKEAGFDVVEAYNGQEAIERLLESAFSLVVLDINMPVLDGYATLVKMRQEYGFEVPVMTVSTESESIDSRRAFELGANFYLVKPVKQAEFIRYVSMMTATEVA